jgi:hypothetical protein
MDAIRKELGESDGSAVDDYRQTIADASMPDAVRQHADRELDRLERMGDSSAESSMLRTYLDVLRRIDLDKLVDRQSAEPDINQLARSLFFIPLGLGIGLLGRRRLTGILLLAAIALPFMIETIQLLVPVIARGCQSSDVVDNLIGLSIGLAIGAVAGLLIGRLRRSG